MSAISCTSTTFSAAADGSGYLMTYTPQATAVASQLTWDTNGSLPLVLSDASNDYIYGPSGTPVEQVSLASSTPTYLTYSPSNDTWLSTNSAGDETGYWGYDAFGNLSFGTPTSAFGYSGQYVDRDHVAGQRWARWYQTQTGGFTSRDPAFESTDAAYTYAVGDPVNPKTHLVLGTRNKGRAAGRQMVVLRLPHPGKEAEFRELSQCYRLVNITPMRAFYRRQPSKHTYTIIPD